MKKFSGIYIIQFENGVKVGITKHFHQRFSSYLSPWCKSIIKAEILKVVCPDVIEDFTKRHFAANIELGSTEFIYDIPYDIVKNFIYSIRGSMRIYMKPDFRFMSQTWFDFLSFYNQKTPKIIKTKIKPKKAKKYKYGFKLNLDKPREEQISIIKSKQSNETRSKFISEIMSQHRERIEKRGTPKAD